MYFHSEGLGDSYCEKLCYLFPDNSNIEFHLFLVRTLCDGFKLVRETDVSVQIMQGTTLNFS